MKPVTIGPLRIISVACYLLLTLTLCSNIAFRCRAAAGFTDSLDFPGYITR